MSAAASRAAGGRVSPMWLIAAYLLTTIGELCLSPVGLSAFSKLAPPQVSSLMMGVFFLSISAGDYLAGRAASVYESFSLPTLFFAVGVVAAAAALVLAVLVRPIRRLMGE
jgi:POT family proton-dependent oligopeptide transporter